MQRVKWAPWWAWCAVGVLLAIGAGVLAYETRGTTFWADEWNWILTRRGGGISTLLDPHNSHLSLVPVAIYKLLLAIAGLRHYWPYRAVLIAADLGCALLVFVYAQRRVGGYLALLATALILFFGPGWQDILWPFQVAWLIAIGTGIGALLLLDREDRAGDIGACVLLAISLASSGAGIAVWIGALVDVGLRARRTRRWRELWIVGIPIVLYAIWWLGYEQSHVSAHAFLLLPRFVFDSAAGALSALSGLATVNVAQDSGNYLTYGVPLLAVALAAVVLVWRARRAKAARWTPSPRVWTLAAMAGGFWLLTGIGRAYLSAGPLVFTETGDESRYLYVSAILIVLLAVEFARGYRPSWIAGGVIGVLAGAAVLSNIGPLRDGAGFLRAQALVTRTELGALDVGRPIVDPKFVSGGFVFNLVSARSWFAAERDLGSIAFNPAQLAAEPEFERAAADAQLIRIHRLALAPAGGSPTPPGAVPTVELVQSGTVATRGACVTSAPPAIGAGGAVVLKLAPGAGLIVHAGSQPALIEVRRFGALFQTIGTLNPARSGTLAVRADLAPAPWQAEVSSSGAFTVCGAG